MELGKRIKKLRRQQGRTLQEIADVCGFTKSLLSKIESDKTSPPVATLAKIAKALGISLSALVETAEQSGTVFIPASKSQFDGKGKKGAVPEGFATTDMGYSFFTFASERLEKKIQPFLFVAEKGKIKGGGLSHEGEEFVYVLEGTMKYQVGSIEYTLGPGDSLYFDAIEEHSLQPQTDKVVYLGVFTDIK